MLQHRSAADATFATRSCSAGLPRMLWLCYDVGPQVCCGCRGCVGILQGHSAADAVVVATFTRPVCCGYHVRYMVLWRALAVDAMAVLGCWNTSLLRMPRLWWYFTAPFCCGCRGLSNVYKTSVPRMPCSLQRLVVQACRGCHGCAMMLERKSAADAVRMNRICNSCMETTSADEQKQEGMSADARACQ